MSEKEKFCAEFLASTPEYVSYRLSSYTELRSRASVWCACEDDCYKLIFAEELYELYFAAVHSYQIRTFFLGCFIMVMLLLWIWYYRRGD